MVLPPRPPKMSLYQFRNQRYHGNPQVSRPRTVFNPNRILGLKPKTHGDECKVKLSHHRNNDTHKAMVHSWGSPENVGDFELMYRCFHEFLDARSPSRLHLTTGNQMCDQFRNCLGQTARDAWDIIVAQAHYNPRTPNNFQEALRELSLQFAPNDAAARQKLYLDKCESMPRDTMVTAVWSQLNMINRLLIFAGDNPNFPNNGPYTEQERKTWLEKIMHKSWRDQAHIAGIKASDLNVQPTVMTQFYTEQQAQDPEGKGPVQQQQVNDAVDQQLRQIGIIPLARPAPILTWSSKKLQPWTQSPTPPTATT